MWTARLGSELKRRVEAHGMHDGRIIRYELAASAIFVTCRRPLFICLHDGASRLRHGLMATALCMVAGWWWVTGLFATPRAVMTNLSGGVDVTPVLEPAEGVPVLSDLQQMKRESKRVQVLFLLLLEAALLASLYSLRGALALVMNSGIAPTPHG